MTDSNQNTVTQDELNAFANAGGRTGAPAPNTSQPTNDEVNAFANVQSPTQVQPHDQSQPGFLSRAKDAIEGVQDFENNLYTGAVKGAGQTVNTISKGISTVVPSVVRPSDVQALEQIETPTNTAQKIGVAGEGIAEFFLMDEGLKALSVADKLGLAAKVAKLAEQHPVVAKLVNAGLNAVRTGTAQTIQAGAHGASAGEALTEGVTAAGTGAAIEGATEGVTEGVRAIAPKVREIAGIKIPVRASQDSAVVSAAEHVAPSKSLQRFHIEQTQPAAKNVIGSVATDLRDVGAQRMGASDTADFRQAVAETGNAKSFWEMTPAERSQAVARAQEIKARRLAPVADLDEAAQQIKLQSKPVYEKLDELTKDRGETFSDLQVKERSAWRKGDVETALKARADQDKIFDQFNDQFRNADDLDNARANWRQASALEKIHDSLNTKAIAQPTPAAFAPKNAPDPGVINGRNFRRQVFKLTNDGTLADAGLTPQHIAALRDLGTLLENSANTRKLSKLVTGGGAIAELLALPTHPVAAAAAVPGFAMSRLLGKVMTDPQFAANVVSLLKAGQRVAPGAMAQATRAVFGGATSLSQ